MTTADRAAMARQLEAKSPEELRELLLEMAEAQRPDSGDGSRQIQDANLILKTRPKVEVHTYLPKTGRIDKRTQDRKVWEAGVIDPLVSEDDPSRPLVVKVVDLTSGEVLSQRDTILALPQPASPMHLHSQVPGQGQPAAAAAVGPASQGASQADLAMQLLTLLRSNPELRRAVIAMDAAVDGAAGRVAPPAVPAATGSAGDEPVAAPDPDPDPDPDLDEDDEGSPGARPGPASGLPPGMTVPTPTSPAKRRGAAARK